MNNLGKYIVVEGPDFSGKDTQAELLVSWLKKEEREVVFIREPGTGWFGEQLRATLLNKENSLTAKTEMLLFMANRSQLLNEIILPSIEKGKIVVSNRDRLSSLAYQGYGRELPLEMIKTIGDFVMEGKIPDLYLVLMLPFDEMLSRRPTSLPLDRIEQEMEKSLNKPSGDLLDRKEGGFYGRVLQGYKDFLKQNPLIATEFDGTLSREEIFSQIKAKVEKLF
jgi:dTMP kinase